MALKGYFPQCLMGLKYCLYIKDRRDQIQFNLQKSKRIQTLINSIPKPTIVIKKPFYLRTAFKFLNVDKSLTTTRSRAAGHTLQTSSVSYHCHTLALCADISSVTSFNCHLYLCVLFSFFTWCCWCIAF